MPQMPSPTNRVCGPGTLGLYFEWTVDLSLNVIYLVDNLGDLELI